MQRNIESLSKRFKVKNRILIIKRMKKFTLLAASLFITIGAMAQSPFDGKKRMTAEELNAVTEKTSILIRCTQFSNDDNFYNHDANGGRTGDATQQHTYFWVPAVEGVAGAYHIMKGDGENDYLQTTNITTYGAKSTAATFHAVKPIQGTSTGVEGIDTGNMDEDIKNSPDYYVRIAFTDDTKWFNFNGGIYDARVGVWTVQNVYNMNEDEEVVEPAVNALATGKYYRLKSVDKYITAPRKDDGEGHRGTSMILSETKSPDNILYYYFGTHKNNDVSNASEKNMLMVYGTGIHINNFNHAHYGYRGSYFFEATESGVLLRIEGGNYCKENGASVTSTANKEDATVWEVEEITALPVSITEAECATLYTPVALRVPDGVTAYYLSQENITAEKAVLTEITSQEIPAGNGVVIYGNEGEYDFEIIENATAFEGTNVLAGTVNDEQITADAYVLFNHETYGLGFYKAEKNSGYFWNLGHKAHLPASAVPEAAASSVGFRFDFATTAIEEVKGENGAEAIYDLQGRRIDEITEPGIYIVNGVKVLVK